MLDTNSGSVAAVVVTYNRLALLLQCLESLLKQTPPLDAIYIIDNASTDGTREAVAERFEHCVIYSRLAENVGSGGALHRGMRRAQSDGHSWLWVMDDDTFPEPTALAELLRHSVTYANASAFTPQKFNCEGEPACSERLILPGGTRPVGTRLEHYQNGPFACYSSIFVGLLVKSSAIQTVGLPIPALFSQGDDTEYCIRLNRVGPVIVVPSARVRHPHGPQPAPAWKLYYSIRNALHFRLSSHLKTTAVPLPLIVLRESARVARRRNRKVRRLAAIALAIVHGLTGRLGRAPSWIHQL